MHTNQPAAQLDPESWVENHGDYLLGYAMLRLRNRSFAEDAVQEALLTAIKAKSRFRGESSERSWLTGILKNKMREAMRKHAREISTEDTDEIPTDPDFDERGHLLPGRMPGAISLDPTNSIDRKEFYETLHGCLSKLPDRTAQAFISTEMDGATTSDVAETLMINKNNLYALLHRARKALRSCLEMNWFADESAETTETK